jgi:hypothetical protein
MINIQISITKWTSQRSAMLSGGVTWTLDIEHWKLDIA